MLRDSVLVGVFGLQRYEVQPFTDRQIELVTTFADQAAIAIENVRLFNETKEALERQTATAEILGVISQSPTDVQPVFDAVAESARQLCNGEYCVVESFDGERLHFGASDGLSPEGLAAFRQALPRPVSEDNAAGRAVLRRMVAQIPDVLEDPNHGVRTVALAANYRSVVAVPMLRHGQAIGAIVVARSVVGLFPERQVELLQTFADQAVIAIENVRLFNETKEALERQTASAEILRVISSSPTDAQPVFDAIAENAARLCAAEDVSILKQDGGLFRVVAYRGTSRLRDFEGTPVSRGSVAGRAILDGQLIHVHDITAESEAAFPVSKAIAQHFGHRTMLAVPLLREGTPLGTIFVRQTAVRPFSDRQIELLRTFADQAVIAIENVRLFKELQEKNRALTDAHAQVSEALEQQTATSDILSVISSSPTDLQPVFDAIAQSARRLCDAQFCHLLRFDGKLLHFVAHHGLTPEGLEAVRRTYPMAPGRGAASARAALSGAVEYIPDVDADPEFRHGASAKVVTARSILAVPVLRDGIPIGAIVVARSQPGPFPDKQIQLLKTFADQAVIAIENVRLFRELEARSQDLTRSVGELRALGEVGQAVSSSLDLETVLTTIVSRAVQLSGLDGGVVFEYDDASETFVQRAAIGTANRATATREEGVRKGEGVVGRTAVTLQPVQIPDISVAGAYEGRIREDLIAAGVRALVAVPILREGRLIGGLAVNRNQPGEFQPQMIDLLRTFATQSSLAIQNARLFRELADKSRQLEAASQHKSEFLANMSHELRTPLNAIIGFSEVLSERMFGELNEKQEEYLKDIYASGNHLLSLINDILDLSKIEAGRMELELSDFHLPTALDSALTLVRERAGRRSIALQLSVDERLGQIQADERKVRQVVLNLLSNAIKFTQEGGRIEVRAEPRDGSVEVSVTDTGVGIAPEDQEAVFEEFRQVGTADKKVEGTGLGLTLCRKFVELHGGRVWVKSQVGVGSTFTFTIPVRRGE